MGLPVFISWSGEYSKDAAIAIREWLPYVIQSVTPFLSSEDIAAGDRWGEAISSGLEQAGFGILCVTPLNKVAPWLLYEAGALSRMVGKPSVAPLLIGIQRAEIGQPLSQFQSVVVSDGEIRKLIKSINAKSTENIDDGRLEKILDKFLPDLLTSLTEIEKKIPNSAPVEDKSQEDSIVAVGIDQILQSLQNLRASFEIARSQEYSEIMKISGGMNSKLEEISQVMRRDLSRSRLFTDIPYDVWIDLDRSVTAMENLLSDMMAVRSNDSLPDTNLVNLIDVFRTLRRAISFLLDRARDSGTLSAEIRRQLRNARPS